MANLLLKKNGTTNVSFPVYDLGNISSFPEYDAASALAIGGTTGNVKTIGGENTPYNISANIYTDIGSYRGTEYPYAVDGMNIIQDQDRYTIQNIKNGSVNASVSSRSGETAKVCCVARAFYLNQEYLGFYCQDEWANTKRWCFVIFPDGGFPDLWNTLSPEPGEQGFVPAGNKGHLPTGGGEIGGWKPVYPGDNLTQPGAPDESTASAIGSGFLTAYKISSGNLALLGRALFDGLLTKLANIFVDPLDSIVSLQVFPCEPTVGSSEPIKLFNYSCVVDKLGVNSSAPPLTKQFKVFDFGTLSVAEMWNSFLDYDATSFELYLPFIGSVDIPVGEVMNGSVNVQYTVDFFTGMCVANVLCTKTLTLSDGSSVTQQTYHSYMGNCSIQIPLHKESFASFVGSLATAAASGLRAPVSLVQSALSGAFKPNIETKGTINANAGFCSVLYPYISITRPVTAMPASYQEVVGFPCYIANKLSECQDLCVCDNIDLSGVSGATDSEMDRIRQLCKDGVYV